MQQRLWRYALALVCTGCVFDSKTAYDQITCGPAPDFICPPGLECQTTINRCVVKADSELPMLKLGSLKKVYVPGGGNPLTDVNAMTFGTTAIVRFSTTKPLAGTPRITTTPHLSYSINGTSQDFEISLNFPQGVGLTPPDGQVDIVAEVEDTAKNPALIDLSAVGLLIDTTPPPPPDVDTPGRIVYVRDPWGSEDERIKGEPTFKVNGFSAAAREAVMIQVLSGAGVRASGSVQPNGSFTEIALKDLVDAPTIDLVSIDGAGNKSKRVHVRDIKWVVTLGAKVAGSSFENPHTLSAIRAVSDALTRPGSREAGALDGVDRFGGGALHVFGAGSWQEKTWAWPGGTGASFTYDSARARTIRFGGAGVSSLTGQYTTRDVWEWNGSDWRFIAPKDPEGDDNPGVRSNAAMAYDEKHKRTMMVGGRDRTLYQDTWFWNGQSWLKGRDGGPDPRVDTSLVYDVNRERFMLFGGGKGDGGTYGDTWVYVEPYWSKLDNIGPLARQGAAMAYDRVSGQTYLFGGLTSTGVVMKDTWAFGDAGWVLIDTPNAPAPRFNATMLNDAEKKRMYLLGGLGVDAGFLNELWEFDGANWTQRATPPATYFPFKSNSPPLFVNDSARGYNIGFTGNRFAWKWDGFTWKKHSAVLSAPAAAGTNPISYFPPKSSVLMIEQPNASSVAQRTLLLSSDGWTDITGALPDAGNIAPPFQVGQQMAYVPGQEQIVYVGGNSAYTFSNIYGWRLQNNTAQAGSFPAEFALFFPPGAALSGPGLAATGDKLYVLRGNSVQPNFIGGQIATGRQGPSGTRIFDGTTWTQGPDAGPNLILPSGTGMPDGGVIFAGAVFEVPTPRAAVVQLIGSSFVSLPDTATGGSLSLTWNAQRNRVIALGGFSGGLTSATAAYEYDGTVWRTVDVSDPEGDDNITGRNSAGLAHHASWGIDVVHGGSEAPGGSDGVTAILNPAKKNDTWYLRLAEHKPGALFNVGLASARIGSGASVSRISMKARIGATGEVNRAKTHGFKAYYWRGGRWRLWTEVPTATADAPELTSPSIEDSTELNQLLTGQTEIPVLFVSRGTNGSSFAELVVDYVQMTLEYRVP